jgi:hypothetical protein
MKMARFITIAFGLLGAVGCFAPPFDLKPGFYAGDDPGWGRLNDLRNKASVHIDLSGHAGISIGDEFDLTLEELRVAVRKVEGRVLAAVLLEKNYIDQSLHLRVEELLLEEGFNAVLITGAHSGGAYLERYTTKAEGGRGQPATGPESKSGDGDKPQPEAEGRSR